ncbi:hypothetical protein KBD69_01780 [Candidatus Woesebacteria bacterium]|nr:hypothetical protein [Candidatus Woesebacteria bacterium]
MIIPESKQTKVQVTAIPNRMQIYDYPFAIMGGTGLGLIITETIKTAPLISLENIAVPAIMFMAGMAYPKIFRSGFRNRFQISFRSSRR